MGENAYSYDYDPIGNRITASELGALSGTSALSTYASNPLNQYTAVTGGSASSPTYDADGNMLTNGPWAYTWDAENRLVCASNATTVVRNAYDHQSRRIRKEVSAYNASTGNFEPVTCNLFLYDGWNPIRETISNQQSAITNYYTWGADLSGTLQGAGGVGGLLAVTCVASGTSNLLPLTYYPLFDANGNITAYLDSTGVPAARFEYDAFGNTISETLSNVSTLELSNFPFRFSTKYLDAETGMYYYGYRFYSPELGRWVSRDPIEEEGDTPNLYSMVQNDPLDLYDALGLFGVGWRSAGGEYVWETRTIGGPHPKTGARKTHRVSVRVPLGHSDFYNGGYFDFVKEDAWFTSPFIQPWLHFRPLKRSEDEAKEAAKICVCDKNEFERAMHRVQDFYSHYEQNYKWDPLNGDFGHMFDGTADDNVTQWGKAQEKTKELVRTPWVNT